MPELPILPCISESPNTPFGHAMIYPFWVMRIAT